MNCFKNSLNNVNVFSVLTSMTNFFIESENWSNEGPHSKF